MKKFYSNSFSGTVREIAEGNISINEIAFVISGTAIIAKEQIRESYSLTWGEKEIKIAERLFDEGKILQPRLILEGEESPFNPWRFGRKALITFCKETFYSNLNDLCDIKNDEEATAHNLWIINRLKEKGLL